MKHCHISIMCNEFYFLKQKLDFLYKYFEQIIFIDYNILENKNSTDGSIEYIENYKDIKNKIKLIKFNEEDLKNIKNYNGVSMIEKRKMFAKGSEYINNDIDLVWATDMDEFFNENLIKITEDIYKNDKKLITLDFPHYIFVYNQYNIFNGKEKNNSEFLCPPRITRHRKGKIYGHCNFNSYGKTIRSNKEFIYHFAFIGVKRLKFKLKIYNRSNNKTIENENILWIKKYVNFLNKKEKYITLTHPNKHLNLKSIPFRHLLPKYIDIETMINELNFK